MPLIFNENFRFESKQAFFVFCKKNQQTCSAVYCYIKNKHIFNNTIVHFIYFKIVKDYIDKLISSL